MSWAKIDDNLHSSPKHAEVSLAATGLWTLCLSWAAHHLTDGHLPAGIVRRLSMGDDTLAAELVGANLWEDAPGGYLIHDYLDYNPTRASVDAEKAKAAERKERWRNAARNAEGTAEERRENADGTAEERPWNGDGTPAPDPDPDPVSVPESQDRQTDRPTVREVEAPVNRPTRPRVAAKPAVGRSVGRSVSGLIPPADCPRLTALLNSTSGARQAFLACEIGEALEAHPEWAQALERHAGEGKDPHAYLAGMVRNWMAGDGAPPDIPPPAPAPTNATDARVARARAYIAPRLDAGRAMLDSRPTPPLTLLEASNDR